MKLVDDEVDDGRMILAIRTTLKRQEGGSMKLKHLIKQVVLLIDDSSSGNKKALKQWIKRRSDLFQVSYEDGSSSKMVSLLSSTDHKNHKSGTNNNTGGGEDSTIYDTAARSVPQDDDDDDTVNISNNNSNSNRNSQRKRKHSTIATSGGDTTNTDITSPTATLNNSSSSMLFQGLIISISTFESKQDNEVDDDKGTTLSSNDDFHNYKTLKQILQSHGATIASQVHKRVHYLIVTNAAVQYLTQRVRQAYKRNVTIVHVSWVQECITMGKIVDITTSKHLCNDEVACLVNEKIDNKTGNNNIAMMSPSITDNTTTGWSTPILLDCCCACHDVNDGDHDDNNNCPWCVKKYGANVDCNIIMLKNQKKE
jgi:hypothetical protein